MILDDSQPREGHFQRELDIPQKLDAKIHVMQLQAICQARGLSQRFAD